MCDNIEEGCYLLNNSEEYIFPYNNKIYACGPNSPLGYYNSDFLYEKISDQSSLALYVDEMGILICNNGIIKCIGFDGKETGNRYQ